MLDQQIQKEKLIFENMMTSFQKASDSLDSRMPELETKILRFQSDSRKSIVQLGNDSNIIELETELKKLTQRKLSVKQEFEQKRNEHENLKNNLNVKILFCIKF